jgi:hypothetical protein
MIITFSFLVLYTLCEPFCTPGLSNAMLCSLIAQFLSLYSGICLVVESYIQKDLINAGQDDTTSQASSIFEVLIVGINLAMRVWPFIMFLVSGAFEGKLEVVLKPIQAFLKVKEPNDSEPIRVSKDDHESASCNENSSGGHILLGSVALNDSMPIRKKDNKINMSENTSAVLCLMEGPVFVQDATSLEREWFF